MLFLSPNLRQESSIVFEPCVFSPVLDSLSGQGHGHLVWTVLLPGKTGPDGS